MTLSPAERPIDRSLAEARLTHDLGDSLRAPQLPNVLHHLLGEFGLKGPEANASLLRLGDTIKLPLAVPAFFGANETEMFTAFCGAKVTGSVGPAKL